MRWAGTAGALKRSLLEDPRFRLVENGHLIKRRGLDGEWQQTVEMPEGSGLPDTIPLLRDGPHLLDPDASSALLVAHEFIDPAGDLARRTLSRLEELWNQEWMGGGYGRYNMSSEPDSPGAWPFASLFVARAYAEARQEDAVMRVLRWLERTEGGKAGTWFENDGPRISPPYPQVGVTPWTWAEIITLFVHHFLGVRPHGSGLTLRPWLPAEVQEMEAVVPICGNWLHLTVRQADSPEARYGVVEGDRVPWTDQGAQLPNPKTDIRVEVFC